MSIPDSIAGDFAEYYDREHFDALVGLMYDDIGPDRVSAHLDAEAKHQQPFGIVHGGVYAGIVESLASVGGAVWANQELGHSRVAGVSNSTDFFRAHREGRLDAVAEPIHRGRSQQVWRVRITRASDGKLVARGQVRLHNLEGDTELARPDPS